MLRTCDVERDVVVVEPVGRHGLDVGGVGDRVGPLVVVTRAAEAHVGARGRVVDRIERDAEHDARRLVRHRTRRRGPCPPMASIQRSLSGCTARSSIGRWKKASSGKSRPTGGNSRRAERRRPGPQRRTERDDRDDAGGGGHDRRTAVVAASGAAPTHQQRDQRDRHRHHDQQRERTGRQLLRPRQHHIGSDDGTGLLQLIRHVPPAGFEPATVGLEVRCSVQLSYEGATVTVQRRCVYAHRLTWWP